MGRKNWKEHVSQKGPGRKARKQKDPELPLKLQEEVKKVKTGALGSRAKLRTKKRTLKAATTKALLADKKATSKKKKVETEKVPERLFQETTDDMSDRLQELSDSSNGKDILGWLVGGGGGGCITSGQCVAATLGVEGIPTSFE